MVEKYHYMYQKKMLMRLSYNQAFIRITVAVFLLQFSSSFAIFLLFFTVQYVTRLALFKRHLSEGGGGGVGGGEVWGRGGGDYHHHC